VGRSGGDERRGRSSLVMEGDLAGGVLGLDGREQDHYPGSSYV